MKNGETVVSSSDPHREEVVRMITYSDLFAFCTLIVGIIELVYIISSKRK